MFVSLHENPVDSEFGSVNRCDLSRKILEAISVVFPSGSEGPAVAEPLDPQVFEESFALRNGLLEFLAAVDRILDSGRPFDCEVRVADRGNN